MTLDVPCTLLDPFIMPFSCSTIIYHAIIMFHDEDDDLF